MSTKSDKIYTLKRVYDPPASKDGFRVLVDRLWPRGLTKEKARVALWVKDIAPTTELRRWYGHDPSKWDDFQDRYEAELDANVSAVDDFVASLPSGVITLVYGARDERITHAIVLKNFLLSLND